MMRCLVVCVTAKQSEEVGHNVIRNLEPYNVFVGVGTLFLGVNNFYFYIGCLFAPEECLDSGA